MLRSLYSALFYLTLPYVFLRLLWRSRLAPQYRKRWKERLGFAPYTFEKSIWIHAVSVGETLAVVPLINALLADYPDTPIVVTTMTPTGAQRVEAAFGNRVKHAYIPYDTPGAIKRFLRRIQPIIAVIVETELWPNMFFYCQKREIPIVVVNARLSLKSQKGYRLIKPLTCNLFSAIHILSTQSQADRDRFIELGMPHNKIIVTGNIKFDMTFPDDLLNQGERLRAVLGEKRPIWIAASTHEGEEIQILDAHRVVCRRFPDALLILVPRHPERFDSVYVLSQKEGWITERRTQSSGCQAETNVYVGDTMGELLLLYAASDIVFVGGSLIPRGGHNLLEPALLHRPVLSGPHLFNFLAVRDLLLKAEAVTLVNDVPTLAESVCDFIQNPEKRSVVGMRAREVVLQNRGALAKQLELVKQCIRHDNF